MATNYTSIDQLIGRTPIVKLQNMQNKFNLGGNIFAKLEMFNPSGSVKDRIAKAIIDDAEKSGRLVKGGVIIEPTSGNTGIGLASVAAARGYQSIIVMPETMSLERRQIIKAYGAKLVLTEGAKGMKGAIAKAEELSKEIEGSIVAGQFVNMANPAIHKATTAVEIWQDMAGEIDYFVAGVGTGGTLSGVGEYLKERNPNIKVFAVEPSDSAVLSGKNASPHKLQGLGAGFVPNTLNTTIYDEIITVNADDAFNTSRLLAANEGLLAGISSGASLWAAMSLASREESKGKNIVVILPDTGERYLSAKLFD